MRGVQTDFAVRGANFGQMLVLVDGVRLNDAQSGHHNGDIPVPLDAVERIEVLYGPGSSLFGADAFGGTVNVITRRTVEQPTVVLEGGSFGTAAVRGQVGFERGGVREALSGSVDRSSGFMYDRDFKTTIVRSRTSLGDSTGVSFSHLWKEFGANNFYGGNAPSREWTNQTLVAADHRFRETRRLEHERRRLVSHARRPVRLQSGAAAALGQPASHACRAGGGQRRTPRRRDGTLTVGVEGGGDWIRSTNLGDHSTARVSGFGEWRQDLGRRAQLDGTMRVDRYNEFGTSWNPSAGVGWWPTSRFVCARRRLAPSACRRSPSGTTRIRRTWRARRSVPRPPGRARAAPTCSSPAGGSLQATMFGRADENVIDWLRPTAADRWRTYNIRDVDTRGVELGIRKTFASGAFVLAEYTALDVDAAAVDQLSKYVLDYAPHSFVAAALLPLPGGFSAAPRLEYRRRSRSTGTFDYVLLDARIGRRIGPALRAVRGRTQPARRELSGDRRRRDAGRGDVVSLALRGLGRWSLVASACGPRTSNHYG